MTRYQPDVTVLRGRFAELPVRLTSENPGFSEDFSDTWASMLLKVDMRHPPDRSLLDADKMQLYVGSRDPLHYTKDSVIGVLVNRLSRRFDSKVGLYVVNSDMGAPLAESGELTYRLQLHPIPDGTDAARFYGAVRQELRQIAQELQPAARYSRGA